MKFLVTGHNGEFEVEGTMFLSFYMGDVHVGCGHISQYGERIEIDLGLCASVSQDPEDSKDFVRVDIAHKPASFRA